MKMNLNKQIYIYENKKIICQGQNTLILPLPHIVQFFGRINDVKQLYLEF